MKDPLKDAMLIFTDGTSHGRAAYVVDNKGHVVQKVLASAQIVELQAVAVVFQLSANNAFTLYTDIHYIFKNLQILETVPYTRASNKKVKMQFQ